MQTQTSAGPRHAGWRQAWGGLTALWIALLALPTPALAAPHTYLYEGSGAFDDVVTNLVAAWEYNPLFLRTEESYQESKSFTTNGARIHLPKFDPRAGTLTSVTVSWTLEAAGFNGIWHPRANCSANISGCFVSLRGNGLFHYVLDVPGSDEIDFSRFAQSTYSADDGDIGVDSYDTIELDVTESMSFSGAALAAFIGTGTVYYAPSIEMDQTGWLTCRANIATQLKSCAGATRMYYDLRHKVSVLYAFEADGDPPPPPPPPPPVNDVPLPASLPLVLTAVAAAWHARRGRGGLRRGLRRATAPLLLALAGCRTTGVVPLGSVQRAAKPADCGAGGVRCA